jgi:hypothetical protein
MYPDHQHMVPRGKFGRRRRGRFEHLVHSHLRIAEKPLKTDLLSPVAGHLPRRG